MSLAQLPDDLLVKLFAQLSLVERHRALPLVCRRYRQLVCSPQLLHTVEVCISGDTDEQAIPLLRSLAQFLVLHGTGRVRQLRLDLGRCGQEEDGRAECMALAATAATGCSGLEELQLDSRFTVTLSSWLLPLRSSLRRLRTGNGTATVVAAPLGLMTALQELELGHSSDDSDIQADARLPTSLTRLALSNDTDFPRMPPQIETLCNLRHLTIHDPYNEADSYAPLAQLSLHTLELLGCVQVVPDCLPALTSLQSLAVDGTNMQSEDEAAVAAGLTLALLQLVQLTRLELAVWSPGPLASLTALTSLRRLCWWATPDAGAALPHGRWLQQLQTFAAPVSLVVHSLPALEGAHSLEQLYPYPEQESQDVQLRSIIRWAAQHPAPQLLLLGDRSLNARLWPEIVEATRLRPSLHIVPSKIVSHGF